MPEAVASNSIPASENQAAQTGKTARTRQAFDGVPVFMADPPFKGLHSSVQRDFDAVEEMLRAYAMMTNVLFENGDDFSVYSKGIHLIHQLIMLRLDEVADHAGSYINQMKTSRHIQASDSDLLQRVGEIVMSAYTDAGWDMRPENMADWSDQILQMYSVTSSRLYKDIMAQLDGDTHLISAGSLLPWAEMKLRRELDLANYESEAADEPATISRTRARLVKAGLQSGATARELSQALNMRLASVERLIATMTDEAGTVRKSA